MGERRCVVPRARRAGDREGQRRPPAPRPGVRRNGRRDLGRGRHGACGDAAAGQGLRSAARDRDELHARGTRRRRRRRHARARALARPAGIRRHARGGVGHRRLGRRTRAGGGDDRADHRGHGGAAPRRQCAGRLRRRADADDDLERGTRRSGRLGAGRRRDAAADRHARPATAPLAAARRQRRPHVPRPGPGGGRRPASVCRRALGRGRVGSARLARSGRRRGLLGHRARSRRRPATPTPRGASPTAASAPRCCPRAAVSAPR